MSNLICKILFFIFIPILLLADDCDTATVFHISGNIAICTVSGPTAPFVQVRFFRFQKDTIITPKYKKDVHGKGYLEFPVPEDTIPEYSTISDDYGHFIVCPFDSGVYRVEMFVELQDSLRLNKFEKSGYCIAKIQKAVIPQIKFNSRHNHYSYAFVNDLDRVDDTSCCEEFKKYIPENGTACKR